MEAKTQRIGQNLWYNPIQRPDGRSHSKYRQVITLIIMLWVRIAALQLCSTPKVMFRMNATLRCAHVSRQGYLPLAPLKV